MNDIAIRVEGLSKQYRIGSAQLVLYKTLRDALTDMVTASFQIGSQSGYEQMTLASGVGQAGERKVSEVKLC